ncbi:MAG: site-2 protease family protein [candidate division WOR-3 bacterium]|nr:MAG: site-2 protease family protein [candidate division WOR-3 bacterium]
MMDEQIISFLSTKMAVEDVDDSAIAVKVKGTIYAPVEKSIGEIKEYFSHTRYTPLFNEENEQHVVQFGIYRKPDAKPKYWLNIILFLATILSTILAGSLNSGGNPFENISDLLLGVPFSLSIMSILTCHELGHYFISRREGMITTLPFFIPVPFHFLGTFGAVIRMKSIVPSRKALLNVGMSGPIAGFLVALPISIIGIYLSEIGAAPETEGVLRLGDSLLFWIIAQLIHPSIPAGYDLYLHPVAFAGWLGLFVTSMNLIPIGQLDGGHVTFSLFLRKRRYLYLPIFGALIALGLLWFGWYFWLLIALFIARRDPVIQDSLTPLSRRERLYAIIPLVVLILTFVPQPFVI